MAPHDRATGLRTLLPATPVARVVTGVAVAGAAGLAVTVWAARVLPIGSPAVRLSWLHGVGLMAVLVALTCVAELVAVRLRHADDAVEELTLLDPMVLLNGMLLAPVAAVGVSLTGIVLAYALRRRALVKAVFNLGTYALASSVLVLLARTLAGADGRLDPELVIGMTAGTAGFVAVNETTMSFLLAALGAGTVRELIREDRRLTGFTFVATTAMAATALSIAVYTPLFLPVTVLPAAAMTYAYRAAATGNEARRRSGHVLTYSRVLSGGVGEERALVAFLELARDGFFADQAIAVLDTGLAHTLLPAPRTGSGPDGFEDSGRAHLVPAGGPAAPLHRELLARCPDSASLLEGELPPGWAQGMVAPLVADGTRIGAVALGWSRSDRRRVGDLAVFGSLAASLAGALTQARQLARLVEESSKLRSVTDLSSDGILVLDGQGRVMLWNPALEVLTEIREDVAVGRPLGELLVSRAREGHVVDAFAVGRALLSPASPHATVELHVVRPGGEVRSVSCAHAGRFDECGRLVRDVVIVHDLTREKRVERLKSDFIATVSHELRTPVTPIKGYAEILRQRWDTMSEEKRVKALDVIADRAAHLGRLVEDLLLASKISTDNEPVHSIVAGSGYLEELAARAAEDFGAERDRLRLVPAAEPVRVECDHTRVVQILTNLLSNALKYSGPGEPVEVAVAVRHMTGTVTVTDHGRGIPRDQLERVFEKFHRVEDPLVMSTGGSGLGLYIARHLARAMGGDLTVDSTLGQGSSFTLSLQLAGPVPVPSAGPGAGRGSGG
ncbi:MAG TPA: ATP-binding protein [Kineosporiaceae bacterium]|nr:ATP-binding protein [Kineosporiaceae bacterium]